MGEAKINILYVNIVLNVEKGGFSILFDYNFYKQKQKFIHNLTQNYSRKQINNR